MLIDLSTSRHAPPSEIFRTIHPTPVATLNEIAAPLNVRCRLFLRLSISGCPLPFKTPDIKE